MTRTTRLLALVLLAGLLTAARSSGVTTAEFAQEVAERKAADAALDARLQTIEAWIAALAPTPTPTPTPIPTAGPTPMPTPAPTPTGNAMPTADLPGFRLIFNDDFTVPVALGQFPAAVSDKWQAYPWGWKDTSQNGSYAPQIVSFHDSLMDIYLHTENGVHMVAAPAPKFAGTQTAYGGTGQLYGRYAVRFRADPVPGYKTAWLLWPLSEVWPRDGEIDFPEGSLSGVIEAYMHRQGATSGGDQDAFTTTARYPDWHTAVIEWTPTRVEFFLDDTSIGRVTNRIPNTPMRWVIQTETNVSSTPPADSAAGHVYLDWVAVWAYTP